MRLQEKYWILCTHHLTARRDTNSQYMGAFPSLETKQISPAFYIYIYIYITDKSTQVQAKSKPTAKIKENRIVQKK